MFNCCIMFSWLLVVFFINVDLAIFQPYLDLEAGDVLCLSLKWFNIFVLPPVYVSSVSHNLHFTVLLSTFLLK